MSNKKQTKVLGKGLSALLNDAAEGVNEAKSSIPAVSGNDKAEKENIGSIALIQLETIEINPFQPRVDFDEEKLKDLAESIEVHGVIQPITVRKLENGTFQLISGERRLRASKMAQLKEIPAYIKNEVTDQESLEIALIENIQREDLNALEIALNYERLIEECKLTQAELSKRVGKKRSTIANYLRLLKLPTEVQYGVKEGLLSMGHARTLVGLEDKEFITEIVKQVIEKQLSVRQVEGMVKRHLAHKESQLGLDLPTTTKTQEQAAQILSQFLTSKVQLKPKKKGKGEIVISYYSEADFKRIVQLLKAH